MKNKFLIVYKKALNKDIYWKIRTQLSLNTSGSKHFSTYVIRKKKIYSKISPLYTIIPNQALIALLI